MKNFVLVFAVLSLFTAQAQTNANLHAMVDAERSFIAMARDQNRREAFLFFLSDDAITNSPDGPVKGKDRIRSQPLQNDLLQWEVAYSDIAASGDFGFNTGPWEYRIDRASIKPAAYGEFNSIWKKQENGSWKNVLDIGIGHGPSIEKTVWSTTRLPLKQTKKSLSPGNSNQELLTVEREFLRHCVADRKTAYKKYISNEARIQYAGHLPFKTLDACQKFLADFKAPTNVRLINGESASSNDLGYVYGTANVTVSNEGKSESKKATYVRVWKKEDGTNWKIVLDVLTF